MFKIETAYLAGRMTGVEDYNYPEFKRVARLIQINFGYAVQNPATNYNGLQILNHDQYILMAIPQVLVCDVLILHGDWETSPGACTEAAVAFLCGKPVFEFTEAPEAPEAPYLRRLESFDIQISNIIVGGKVDAAI